MASIAKYAGRFTPAATFDKVQAIKNPSMAQEGRALPQISTMTAIRRMNARSTRANDTMIRFLMGVRSMYGAENTPGRNNPRLPRAGAIPTTTLEAPRVVRSSGMMVLDEIRENPNG